MFEDLRRAFRELLDGNVAPSDRRELLQEMRGTLVQARMAVDDLRQGIEVSEKKLARERTELETVLSSVESQFEAYAPSLFLVVGELSDTRVVFIPPAFPGLVYDPDVLRLVIRLLDGGPVSDADYARFAGTLGEAALAEIVWLVGYYSMLALALRVFDPPIGTERRAPWKRAD